MSELSDLFDYKFFKLLAEPARVEILHILATEGELNISQITEFLPQERSVVSRHLSAMCEAGFLHSEKRSRHIYYSVDALGLLERLETMASLIRTYFEGCCPEILEQHDKN